MCTTIHPVKHGEGSQPQVVSPGRQKVTQGVSYCSAGDIAKSDFTEAYEPLLEIKYDYGKLCMSYLSMPFYGLNGAMVAACTRADILAATLTTTTSRNQG